MASLSVTYDGPPAQRHVAKPSAMTPLSAVLAEVCAKMKPPLDPGRCTLLLNKKPLDLSLPFRLANIPNGSALVLQCSGGRAGTAAAPAPAAQPAAAAAAMSPPPAATSAASTSAAVPTVPQPIPADAALQAASMAAAAEAAAAAAAGAAAEAAALALAAAGAAAAAVARAASLGSSAAAAPAPPPEDTHMEAVAVGAAEAEVEAAGAAGVAAVAAAPDAPNAAAAAGPAAGSAETAAAAQPLAQQLGDAGGDAMEEDGEAAAAAGPSAPRAAADTATAATPSAADGPDVLGVGRPVALFTRQALEEGMAALHAEEAAAVGGAEEGEEFFEYTAEDFAMVMRAKDVRKRKEEVGLKTRALREADERARAEGYGPVAVRVHLPDDVILQASFSSTETVGAVRALVAAVLAPALGPALYLYTTPPRQLLKDAAESLYHAQLVPAAHIHAGLDEKKVTAAGHNGPALRPEARALVLSHVDAAALAFPTARGQQQPQQQQAGAGGGGGAPGAGGSGAQRGAGGGGGVGASSSSSGPSGGAGGKGPKWMRLGAR